MSLEQFFSMGGYALYVWSAYGFALALLLINLVLPLRRLAALRKDISRALRQEAARQERARP